ncbi:MAG: hypothetical protein ACRCZF_02195 [Gemmataceae bacterium]
MPATSEVTSLSPESIWQLQRELAECKALKRQFFELVNSDGLITEYFNFTGWSITRVSTGLRWTIVNDGISIVSQNGASAFLEICDRAYRYARITDFQVIEDLMLHAVMPDENDLWAVFTREMAVKAW